MVQEIVELFLVAGFTLGIVFDSDILETLTAVKTVAIEIAKMTRAFV